MVAAEDVAFMERALLLAERGRGRTTPNPLVGAVVVSREGVVVGQGAHLVAGGPHAEVVALDKAGTLARGATLYCTLEPCCHVGRTGPCVERIEDAGIARVVAAITDPDPRVSGQGFSHLRAHGIEVNEGVGGDAARHQNAPFITWVTKSRPHVTLKAAISADGFVGRATERVKLTGEAADRFFHRQRAGIDAIAAGANTVLVDDPLLTARGAYRFRPLTRVIFDWRGRVPADRRVFSTLDAGPVIMITSPEALQEHRSHFDMLMTTGVVVAPFPAREIASMLRWLAARDVQSLLVEGGPELQRAFGAADVVDRVQIVRTSRTLDAGIAAGISEAIPGAGPARETSLGADLLVEFDVHGTH